MKKTQPSIQQIIDQFNTLIESEGSKVRLIPSSHDKYNDRDCYKASLSDRYISLSFTDEYIKVLDVFLSQYGMKAQIAFSEKDAYVLPFVYKESPDNITKITYAELCEKMREHNNRIDEMNKNREKGDKYISHGDNSIKGVIVIKERSFSTPYPLESRSYIVNSDNKAWISGMSGYSIYGGSIDKTDPCVRLEQYLQNERGGESGWEVEYCYML